MANVEHVRDLITPVVSGLGLDLYDLERPGSTLKITVDREGGVGIDDITVVTRLISRALDADESITASYTLEVSSPGLERTLRTPAHFARAVGETVSVKTVPEFAGDRRLRGTLTASDDDGIDVAFDDGHSERIGYADIEKAKTVFEWGSSSSGDPKPHARQKKHPKKKEAAA